MRLAGRSAATEQVTPCLASVQNLALAAARAGAQAIGDVVRGRELTVSFKHGGRADPVTSADLASDQAIRALIAASRGADAIYTEESGQLPGSGTVRWVVDPLDGTVNFTHGLRRYAVSVAAQAPASGETIAAAVCEPATGRWLSLDAAAVAGSPPRIGVTAAEPAAALLAFAVPSGGHERATSYRLLARLAPRVQDLRNTGSTVCDLACVAVGELDGFVSICPAPWDLAAGLALVTAAGGCVRRWPTRDGMEILVAGGPAVVPAVAEWLGRELDDRTDRGTLPS